MRIVVTRHRCAGKLPRDSPAHACATAYHIIVDENGGEPPQSFPLLSSGEVRAAFALAFEGFPVRIVRSFESARTTACIGPCDP